MKINLKETFSQSKNITGVLAILDMTYEVVNIHKSANGTYYISYDDGAMSRVSEDGWIEFNPYNKNNRKIETLLLKEKFPEYYL